MKYDDNTIIGYSAFILFEECYEYNENACYIADTPEALLEFLKDATFNTNDYRIDAIRLNDIVEDYGCSYGEFAMEPEALKRFEQAPDLRYTVELFDDYSVDGASDLFVINIKKKPNVNNDDFTIPGILASFSAYDGIYKREQIDAAIQVKDEIIPHLIEILEKAYTDYEKYISDEDLYNHIYALMLLGHFKESKSHKVIVDLFSLPGDIPDKLFADIITSDLPIILLNTCGGSVELIKSLILNKEADDYCRLSACQALSYAVIKEYVSRESVLELFGTLFSVEEADEMSDFWGLLANFVCYLYPEEIMDIIKQAYEDSLIAPGMIHYGAFEEALKMGKDKCLEKLKEDLERNSYEDMHKAMSWWACFNEKSDALSPLLSSIDYPIPTSKKSKKTKSKKKKRKQAKASKKKNRR